MHVQHKIKSAHFKNRVAPSGCVLISEKASLGVFPKQPAYRRLCVGVLGCSVNRRAHAEAQAETTAQWPTGMTAMPGTLAAGAQITSRVPARQRPPHPTPQEPSGFFVYKIPGDGACVLCHLTCSACLADYALEFTMSCSLLRHQRRGWHQCNKGAHMWA